MNLSDVEKLLHGIACPLCGEKDVAFKFRCDLGYDGCLTTLQCRRCHYEFEAEQTTPSGKRGPCAGYKG